MSLKRFAVICTSDFNLYNRFLSDEDLTPVLEQRSTLGFNACRVWTCYDIPLIGRLNPYEHPEFFTRLPEFMGLLADWSLYAEITAFTGPYPFFANQAAMVQYWDDLDAALTGCDNLLDLEAINEYDNAPNAGVPLNLLRRPSDKRASHGSGSQDSEPVTPFWDVAGYRAPSSEWQRKVGHNAMEWADSWNIPVWTNEYPRVDLDPNPDHWFDGAASSVLLCAGAGCFHSRGGKDSTLFQPGQELDCANAFIAGAQSVPLEFQAGAYVVNNPPYPDGVIRIYERRLSDGRSKQVPVRG